MPLPAHPQGVPAAGAQKLVGYKGSTAPGSAPTCVPPCLCLLILPPLMLTHAPLCLHSRRDGKAGMVYRLSLKNNKANIDEYAPIYTPEVWKFDGDNYEPGLVGLAAWAATLGAILLGGAFAVYSTSAL